MDNKNIVRYYKGDVFMTNKGRNEWKAAVLNGYTSDIMQKYYLLEIRYEIGKNSYVQKSFIIIIYQN